jgi:hypothetical protein
VNGTFQTAIVEAKGIKGETVVISHYTFFSIGQEAETVIEQD